MEHTLTNDLSPVKSSERVVILDALRGFALLGIVIANFPEFSLYTFMSAEDTALLPFSAADRYVRYLLYFFIDGKFYTIFSLLFGIGFSIILENVAKRGGNAMRVFYRRMFVLAFIGALHLMFIWSGDILLLYALLGMLLPLFRKLSDRILLTVAAVLLFIPVVIDFLCEATRTDLSAPVVQMQRMYCTRFGITDDNFAYWLRDASSYREVFQFLIQGALVRIQEFIDGNRYFKVLGLFIIGFYIGRQHLYARLEEKRIGLKKIFGAGILIGLPFTVLYAYSTVNSHPWGLAMHSLIYFFGVYPLAFAYISGVCLLLVKHPGLAVFHQFAVPGRMALTNYIGQSVIGILLFYGIGLGFGAGIGLGLVVLIAAGVWMLQAIISRVWLHYCQFGILEWMWRMLTYGKTFRLVKKRS
ncbi:DUF418 domain-containing protein [Parabacteroides sp. AGMB00274]|uniref:DUF418 domain-containing protein n=1 Tax=Parabacteroides faecalis TaxID=2924040 RepID=A0ABT0BXK9_9BACT|nr:DUF418 domain-containing protein [Parabacteroides faecalis]MCJ2379514.1 DUF418 domain-containing protein [Parabacteroides faecalis]MDY6254830.1 DUF418 domain-containing protein [Bacteroidales bacterium]